MPADIEIISPEIIPTVCAPVTAFNGLTTVSNAFTLGWYGFIAGCAVPVIFWIAYTRAGPWIVYKLGWA